MSGMTDRIPLYVTVDGTPTDPEDEGVCGTYMVEVDSDLDRGDQASAALDVLANHVAIACLDDFSFTVRDGEGRIMDENRERESYELADRGVFCGAVDGPPAAAPAC